MKAVAGARISWRGVEYEVVMVRELAALLRDPEGSELEVSIDELNRGAEVAAPMLRRAANGALFSGEVLAPTLQIWRDAIERIRAASETFGLKSKAVDDEAERLSRELGRPVSSRTVYRQLQAYERDGLGGLLDQRAGEARQARTRTVDARVVEVLNSILGGRSRSSTISKAALIEQVRRAVVQTHGHDVKIPSNATFYRLLEDEDRGRFSFGSAKTRESLALAPDREYGSRTALRPGEQVQIDTTRLDVMVRIDEVTIGRPELTIMLDVATRSILAAVLRPEGTKSMDLVVVLGRALVPYSHRPDGARETRQLISTAWAEDVLIDQARFERLRAAQPFIFPETITTDRGRTYLSTHFRAACETLGISLITAAPHTPTDKPHVERTFESIASLFLLHARGYVGRSVEHRGRDVESQSEQLLTIAQMQEMLEDWVAVEWQNRSHDGLRDPLHPKIALSPNEMCRAFRHVVPELHVPLKRDDFIALLPVTHRRINRYGVTIDHRVYDSKRLAEYRRRQSPVKSKQGRWPVRVDPYNLHVVWLDVDGEFIPLRWSNRVHELPMLGDVWRYARAAHGTPDETLTADRRELAAALKAFAGRGNPAPRSGEQKRSARQRARELAVADDPMNLTSIKNLDDEDSPAEALDTVGEAAPSEDWPHTGGFPFISDSLDEVRRRIDE